MKVEIKVPEMGESISEAVIGAFLKEPGTKVSADEEILELETDKVNQSLYAPSSGVVFFNVKQGDTVSIGDVIGYIDTDALETQSEEKSKEDVQVEKKKEKETKEEQKEIKQERKELKEEKPKVRFGKQDFIEDIKNTHIKGEKEELLFEKTVDKENILEKVSVEPREERKPMSKIRQVIAKRLVEAKNQTAMLTTFNEVDMSKIIELRKKYKEMFLEKYQVKLGFMSFFVKAVTYALKAFPQVNAYIDGLDIVYRNYFDIGVAVSTDRGLVVPVIRDANCLSFAEIEKTIVDYSTRARKGGISVDELQGGSFTITNGGVFGSLLSTPILNLPQCAILGMHTIQKRAVVVDDKIEIRPMMYLALSYDHRLIDGKEAVSFLVYIKKLLEDPSRMLIEGK